jgi:hypothetical protein
MTVPGEKPMAIDSRSAVRSEWRLIAATHNILKLHHHRLAAMTT